MADFLLANCLCLLAQVTPLKRLSWDELLSPRYPSLDRVWGFTGLPIESPNALLCIPEVVGS